MQCGLLGEKLGHSYSPQIHAELADYEYRLYEKNREEVEAFVLQGDWHGMNVTIPYKKTVVPFCDELSETAETIGSVNTLLRREDGTIYGDNTDAFGFETLLRSTYPTDLSGKKALVLGTGGASVTVCAVLRKHGAEVIAVTRKGENNYDNLSRHADAALLVNTTPLGMYPNNGTKAVDLTAFPALEAVLDVVYNPARTALLLQAEELGIPCAGGLIMLVAQAKRSAEIFLGRELPDSELARITGLLSRSMQ
ncbi:MAG: shikimate dehydrogenase, partial [Oscillospiraceae bacterium]|nr:shikimate dehydrogenase [Oscillospiraceae bacterium]